MERTALDLLENDLRANPPTNIKQLMDRAHNFIRIDESKCQKNKRVATENSLRKGNG